MRAQKSRGWLRRVAVGLLLLGGPSALAVAQGEPAFELLLAGMIAFVPLPPPAEGADNGGFEVLMVNEYNRPIDALHEVTHFPLLEFTCEQLVKDSGSSVPDEPDCESWPPTTDRLRTVLSLHQGFDVQITVGDGVAQAGPVAKHATFDELVVPMADLSDGDLELETLREEAMAGHREAGNHVIARLVLNGGTLTPNTSTSGSWKFKRWREEAAVLELPAVADSVTWKIDYVPKEDVTVTLTPLAGGAARKLTFRSDGGLTLVLANEPDVFEFCAHAPDTPSLPFEHFLAFYDLTRYATHPDLLAFKLLPLPYADEPERICTREAMQGFAGGRRVPCMTTQFSPAE